MGSTGCSLFLKARMASRAFSSCFKKVNSFMISYNHHRCRIPKDCLYTYSTSPNLGKGCPWLAIPIGACFLTATFWLVTINFIIPTVCERANLTFEFILRQVEGSVDEESTKSDEEYDDLAIQDGVENGYRSDDDKDIKVESLLTSGSLSAHVENNKKEHKYSPTLDMFLRSRSEPLTEALGSCTSMMPEKTDNKIPSNNIRMRKHSPSIPGFGKRGECC